MKIFWFYEDLRLHDNVGLIEACKNSIDFTADSLNSRNNSANNTFDNSNKVFQNKVLPIYIYFDDKFYGNNSKWWLNESLNKLNESINGNLNVYSGNIKTILADLVTKFNVTEVYKSIFFSRIELNKEINEFLQQLGVKVFEYNTNLLWNHDEILNNENNYYKVFTHFYKNAVAKFPFVRKPMQFLNEYKSCLVKDEDCSQNAQHDMQNDMQQNMQHNSQHNPQHTPQHNPQNNSSRTQFIFHDFTQSDMITTHDVGEIAAKNKLKQFIEKGLNGYKIGRNFPYMKKVSKLSPHLHFGEISICYIWHEIKKVKVVDSLDEMHTNTITEDTINQATESTTTEHITANTTAEKDDIECFLSELGWREFSYYLLHYFPALPTDNFVEKFDAFPWKYDENHFHAWKNGLTGYPIVDAGMRELKHTGYMHNRVRMIVASFLIKNLLIDWRHGERWFWDYLVDADIAANSASWQWVAGSGADAAPYFRIFNPFLQSEKFDSEGKYIKSWIPELKNVPSKMLHDYMLPESLLKYGVELGKDYPHPIVNLKESRYKALNIYKSLNGKN